MSTRTRVCATHTFAVLGVPPEVWDEIAERLREADYDHTFVEDDLIDMHGIALRRGDGDDEVDATPEED